MEFYQSSEIFFHTLLFARTWLLWSSMGHLSCLHGHTRYMRMRRYVYMHGACAVCEEHPNEPRMAREDEHAYARDAIEVEAEVINRIETIDVVPLKDHCEKPHLPNDQDFAVQVSCEGREPAGKGGRYSPATASGLGALRGTSRHIGDHAGEGVPPRPHRDLPPLITPSKEAVGDEESNRAVD